MEILMVCTPKGCAQGMKLTLDLRLSKNNTNHLQLFLSIGLREFKQPFVRLYGIYVTLNSFVVSGAPVMCHNDSPLISNTAIPFTPNKERTNLSDTPRLLMPFKVSLNQTERSN